MLTCQKVNHTRCMAAINTHFTHICLQHTFAQILPLNAPNVFSFRLFCSCSASIYSPLNKLHLIAFLNQWKSWFFQLQNIIWFKRAVFNAKDAVFGKHVGWGERIMRTIVSILNLMSYIWNIDLKVFCQHAV